MFPAHMIGAQSRGIASQLLIVNGTILCLAPAAAAARDQITRINK